MSDPTFNTPMMQQYMQIKKQYPDALLFFRMGDFYELFLEDAHIGADVLDITLTSRHKGQDGAIPMCGVPHHSVESYIARLVNAGHKVAVCEQVAAGEEGSGLVERDVVRVVTPGTILDENAIPRKEPNYLMVLDTSPLKKSNHAAIAFVDLGTADFQLARCEFGEGSRALEDMMTKFNPKECILSSAAYEDARLVARLRQFPQVNLFPFHTWGSYSDRAESFIKDVYNVVSIEAVGLRGNEDLMQVAAVALGYLQETQKGNIQHIATPRLYSQGEYVELDRNTIINLELFRTIRDGEVEGSLLWLLDKTRTAMGGRLLRAWLTTPSQSIDELNRRLDVVEYFVTNTTQRTSLQTQLEAVLDLERIVGRLHVGSGNARDLTGVRQSLEAVEEMLTEESSVVDELKKAYTTHVREIKNHIATSIKDDPAVSIREGNMIRDGFSTELDELRSIRGHGKDILAQLEERERAQTGISNLKVASNRVFGYYIEISKSHLAKVPPHYIRKQTLVNAERFITPELKEHEEKVFTAEERMVALEYELFIQTVDRVLEVTKELLHLSKCIARLDVLCGFAELSQLQRYTRPQLTDDDTLDLKNSRHPVVEVLLTDTSFVPNDVYLDSQTHQVVLLTGPNMAGKSTYIRQVAVCVLMAHLGCFVSCDKAVIGIVDKLFTRVGASDNLARGLSTFMVEMVEVSNILNHATSKSLIILDEVGRGTSTYDGVSIAWAVVEYLAEHPDLKPKTLFATHFHELLALGDRYDNVANFQVVVELEGKKLHFLHRVMPGGTDKSYGIEVARLAGIPEVVIDRAEEILVQLENKDSQLTAMPHQPPKRNKTTTPSETDQLGLL